MYLFFFSFSVNRKSNVLCVIHWKQLRSSRLFAQRRRIYQPRCLLFSFLFSFFVLCTFVFSFLGRSFCNCVLCFFAFSLSRFLYFLFFLLLFFFCFALCLLHLRVELFFVSFCFSMSFSYFLLSFLWKFCFMLCFCLSCAIDFSHARFDSTSLHGTGQHSNNRNQYKHDDNDSHHNNISIILSKT